MTSISDPSNSIEEINIPEIKDLSAEFVYNFYVKDERLNSYTPPISENRGNPSKEARYVVLRWTNPPDIRVASESEVIISSRIKQDESSLLRNVDKITSEDKFFNSGFVCHTFSNVDIIEQGGSDLENHSLMSGKYIASLSKISDDQKNSILTSTNNLDQDEEVISSYSMLSDFPKNSLGLRIYNQNNEIINDDVAIRSIVDSLSLRVKIKNGIIPDIFNGSTLKENKQAHRYFSRKYHSSNTDTGDQNFPFVKYDLTLPNSEKTLSSASYIGYIIDRFILSPSGLKKDATFYIDNIATTTYYDFSILYGKTYIYQVRVIGSIDTPMYDDSNNPVNATMYISSKAISSSIECHENVPPPPPNDIRFSFDNQKRNLLITWNTPVNTQSDIKQFQIFRRKTLKEPFELIAQYSFDDTELSDNESSYKTGEKVDGNNSINLDSDLKYLLRYSDNPVYIHRDEDFTVDLEFFISSDYIYSICSIDAHGMISNYSAQYRVSFDALKNRLVADCICNEGSPRQYPNMNLKFDAFKDAINISGEDTKQMKIYFTPEYLAIKDNEGKTEQIVNSQTKQNNIPFYILQLINLDNQKSQLVKIVVKDDST